MNCEPYDGHAINDLGVVAAKVASGTIASIGSHAAAWYPTPEGYEFVLLGALPGQDYSTATGVNNLGDIVAGRAASGWGSIPAARSSIRMAAQSNFPASAWWST